jgi:RNA polymerase sigma-70 factor (ECF subfamily)
MTDVSAEKVRESLDEIYRLESRRVLATLIRLLGDFDLAEDALHDAFRRLWSGWPNEGVPPTRVHGWFLPGGSRPSTRFGDALVRRFAGDHRRTTLYPFQ